MSEPAVKSMRYEPYLSPSPWVVLDLCLVSSCDDTESSCGLFGVGEDGDLSRPRLLGKLPLRPSIPIKSPLRGVLGDVAIWSPVSILIRGSFTWSSTWILSSFPNASSSLSNITHGVWMVWGAFRFAILPQLCESRLWDGVSRRCSRRRPRAGDPGVPCVGGLGAMPPFWLTPGSDGPVASPAFSQCPPTCMSQYFFRICTRPSSFFILWAICRGASCFLSALPRTFHPPLITRVITQLMLPPRTAACNSDRPLTWTVWWIICSLNASISSCSRSLLPLCAAIKAATNARLSVLSWFILMCTLAITLPFSPLTQERTNFSHSGLMKRSRSTYSEHSKSDKAVSSLSSTVSCMKINTSEGMPHFSSDSTFRSRIVVVELAVNIFTSALGINWTYTSFWFPSVIPLFMLAIDSIFWWISGDSVRVPFFGSHLGVVAKTHQTFALQSVSDIREKWSILNLRTIFTI